MTERLRVAVLASGGGTNLQALLDHATSAWDVTLVLSDRADAGALDRADRAGIAHEVVVTGPGKAGETAAQMLDALDRHDIGAIVLAGYLKLVPKGVVAAYADRIINIHPALLPSFGGKGMYGIHVHRAVLEAGVRVTGVTVHLVDEAYDRGRIIAQRPVPVLAGDSPETVAARVLEVEHSLYPRVVDHLTAAWRAGRDPEPMDDPGDVYRLASSNTRV
ncbi:MAG: phosphoribosylglycinamide formyltransferase [Gemmatimonadota bacterium]